jgi:hypothetical protein
MLAGLDPAKEPHVSVGELVSLGGIHGNSELTDDGALNGSDSGRPSSVISNPGAVMEGIYWADTRQAPARPGAL